jgi:hypothetical protein
MFDKLYEEIIEILNMTDTAKLTQILELYKEDPVFSLKVDRMQFNIDLDSQFELDYVFLYIQQDKINKMEIMYPQWVIHGGDPDEDLNWDLRDKKIVRNPIKMCFMRRQSQRILQENSFYGKKRREITCY